MNILALDLGTKTGFAYNRGDDFQAGTWKLASSKEITAWGKQRITRRNDPRIDRLCELLTALGKFDVVVFEDVTFSTTTYQTQLWSALRAALWLCADGAFFEAVPVSTLKKFATDSGSADKSRMANALRAQYPMIFHPSYDDKLWLEVAPLLQKVLTPEERCVLELNFCGSLNLRECGELLNRSRASMSLIKIRALKKLQRALVKIGRITPSDL